MTPDHIKLELTMEECDLFRKFQQYHDLFQTLVDSGLLTVRNGQVILNFNSNGDLHTVEIHQNTYRRRATDTVV